MACVVAAVVPSLGVAAVRDEALAGLRRELATVDSQLVWVHQGSRPAPPLSGPRERLIHLPSAAGFAAAVNRGCAEVDARWIAIVNDDVVLDAGWLTALLAAAGDDAGIVAAQGINLQLATPELVDGAGLTWNRRWQALQLGHGEPSSSAPRAPFEIFGVSATAALYRRDALLAVSSRRARPFDERLDSWYEDVDLAVRLAARGGRSLVVPAARARHAGSATGSTRPFRRGRLLIRNRWLVTARLLGRRWPAELPAIVRGDLGELGANWRRRNWRSLAAIAAGWSTALIGLPAALHAGDPESLLKRLAELPSTLGDRGPA